MKLSHSSLTYQRHRTHLIAYACARGCHAQDAEDLVHDLFAMLVRVGRYDELTDLPAGEQCATLCCRLRSLIMNRWRDHHRQRRDQRRVVPLADVEDLALTVSMRSTPATELDRTWAMDAIEAALDRVRTETTAQHWHIVEASLRGDAGGREHDEGPPSAANRVALCRARKRLRSLISHDELHAALCTTFHQP